MEKIKELTKEQEAMIPVYRDKGLAIGNSTEPANWDVADQAIKELYEFSGLPLPEKIYHCGSPYEAQKLINELTGEDPKKYHSTHGYGYGQHESYWIYTYGYYIDVLKVKVDEKAERGLAIMQRLCESSGFHYIFDKFAIICDRPSEIHLNENNELHNPDGPAVVYRDGYNNIYAINGHYIPAESAKKIIFHPETITIDDINSESNAEIARMLIEKYDMGRYLIETGAKILDVDALGLDGSATRTLVQDSKGLKWLIGSDGSTKRTYNMSVPSEVMTCKEAHDAIAGFDESRMIAES